VKIFFCLLLFWSASIVSVFSATYTGVINIDNNSISGGSNCTQGNDRIKSETRDLASFQEIKIAGAFTVSIRCGKMHRAVLTMDSNILPLIQTTVNGNILHIENNHSICVENPLNIFLTVGAVERINADGSNYITVECETYNNLSLTLSGTSELKLFGKGQSLIAFLEDATEFDAGKSIFKTAQINTSSASTAVVVVEQSLIAKSSDASEIYYNDSVLHIQKTISDASEILPLSEKYHLY